MQQEWFYTRCMIRNTHECGKGNKDMDDSLREALGRLVLVARKAKKCDDAMFEIGYGDTPYFEIYGQTADAIYSIVGENTERFDESATYQAINHDGYTDEERLQLLCETYAENHKE